MQSCSNTGHVVKRLLTARVPSLRPRGTDCMAFQWFKVVYWISVCVSPVRTADVNAQSIIVYGSVSSQSQAQVTMLHELSRRK